MHNEFKIGDLVKVNVWTGKVLDVYTSSASGEIVLKILFCKNVFKGQDAELHSLKDLSEHMRPATRDELMREVETLERKQTERKSILLKEATQ